MATSTLFQAAKKRVLKKLMEKTMVSPLVDDVGAVCVCVCVAPLKSCP